MTRAHEAGTSKRGIGGFVNSAVEESLLLPLGAAAGLVWANVAIGSYERFSLALSFLVNDIGMVFFFALAAKEVVESMSAGGSLDSPRRAATPVLAALGGIVGPALVYLWLVQMGGTPALARGWAVPTATDIAFSYLAARFIFGAGHPALPFLLLLAIVDDALGLIILAVFYPSGPLRLLEFAVIFVVALLSAYFLRRRGTRSVWPYLLVPGVLSWLALLRGGIHPALALVPIVPFMPRPARDPGLFVPAPDSAHDTLSEFEHQFKRPVEFILLAFGLVNAGVPLGAVGAGTWAVFLALVIGKPLGIVAACAAGGVLGLRLPDGLAWKDLVVMGLAAAIGFTVALFFATAAFPPGPLLDQVKAGALLSLAGGAAAAIAAWLLRAGRFKGSRV